MSNQRNCVRPLGRGMAGRTLVVACLAGLAVGSGAWAQQHAEIFAGAIGAPAAVALEQDIRVVEHPEGGAFQARRVLVRLDPTMNENDAAGLMSAVGVLGTLETYAIVPGLRLVEVPDGFELAIADVLSKTPGVMYAHVDRILTLYGSTQVVPYGINLVNAPQAWTATRGAGVRVAVLDTGWAIGHQDLPVPEFSASFISGQTVADGNQHGTHVSGTVLGRDNNVGVIGVAPEATLLTAKVCNNSGGCPTSSSIGGVNWAAQNNADVINMSLGGTVFDQGFADACAAAIASGVTIVAAAGNSNSIVPSYPASYEGVISVASIDSSLNRSSFSNFGPTVDVTAPGTAVFSSVPQLTIGNVFSYGGSARTVNSFTGSGTGDVTTTTVFCGFGGTAADFPANVAGRIALIQRGGGITFQTKATNAAAAGAAAVLIANNTTGALTGQLNTTLNIPVLGILQADGDFLQANPSTQVRAARTVSGPLYANLSGTSMASPHVAGVVALMVAAVGRDRAAPSQIEQVLISAVQDLGDPGRDDLFGNGLVKADLAVNGLLSLIGPPPSACSPADIANTDGDPGPDLAVDSGDFSAFFTAFFLPDGSAGKLVADIANTDGDIGGDTQVNNGDFTLFFSSFFVGCP